MHKSVLGALGPALALLALAGCAALECDTHWYETGRRDGVLGADREIESYAARCGDKLDRARYIEGLQVGLGMRPRVSAF
jgi:hypothetical protein